ncbi:MAG: vWA domain-containing protein [Rubrobacteraceae bacterium]
MRRVLVYAASLCLLALLVSCGGSDGAKNSREGAGSAEEAKGPQQSEESVDSAAEVYGDLAGEHGADEIPVPRDPKKAYAMRLAESGEDYSECGAETTISIRTCQKPASLGERELKNDINVQLILDASGSMRGDAGGERKMDAARRVLTDFIATLPDTANVALRVYGHVGSSARADRARSCGASELILPFQELNPEKFTEAVNSFEPRGWTPVAGSLEKARDDFARFDPETNSNFVYMVSDGIETCGGDPVSAARGLAEDDIKAEVNIVGFDADPKAARQLREAALSGGGSYYGATDAGELNQIFQERFDWTEWTAYYNCIEGNAYSEYNTETGAAYSDYNCLTGSTTPSPETPTPGTTTSPGRSMHCTTIFQRK